MPGKDRSAKVTITVSAAIMIRVILLVVAAVSIWYAGEVLLVIFAGILVAVLVRAAVHWVQQRTRLGPRISYMLVLLSICAVVVGAGFGLGPRVADQVGEFVQFMPKALERLSDAVNNSWAHKLFSLVSSNLRFGNVVGSLRIWLSSGIEQLTLLIVGVVLGFFFGADPALYIRGTLKLVPEHGRNQAAELFSEIAYTLRWWVVGQLIPMTVLGVGAFIGLALLHVPLAFTLALFTAIMLFVPYVGSLISLIPAALAGLMQGPVTMLWVIVIYLGVHAFEGYLVTPLSQKRIIRLPPVVTISAQLFMWTIAGLLGLVVATPLAAAVVVAIKMLYWHERPVHVHSRSRLAAD